MWVECEWDEDEEEKNEKLEENSGKMEDEKKIYQIMEIWAMPKIKFAGNSSKMK